MTSLRRLMFAKAASGGSGGGWRTATGAVASFIATRSTALPMEFDLVPIQDLHGQDAPYPPGGGKNKWNPTGYTKVQGTVSLDGDTYTITWSSGALCLTTKNVQTFPAGTYYISTTGTNTNNVIFYVYNAETNAQLVAGAGRTFVNASVPFYVGIGGSYNNPGTAVFKVQLESGSSATAYAPYSNLCPISGHTGFNVYDEAVYDASATPKRSTTFPTPPGTVYGGHVTDNGDGTGTLTVNYINYPLTTPFRVDGSGKNAQYLLANAASGHTLATNPFLCNRYKPSNYSASLDNHIHFANDSLLAVMTSDEIGTTPTAWSDYFTDNPTYVCYKLKTPQTYTLQMTAINSLIGQNHVWVDNADSVTVEYWGH